MADSTQPDDTGSHVQVKVLLTTRELGSVIVSLEAARDEAVAAAARYHTLEAEDVAAIIRGRAHRLTAVIGKLRLAPLVLVDENGEEVSGG